MYLSIADVDDKLGECYMLNNNGMDKTDIILLSLVLSFLVIVLTVISVYVIYKIKKARKSAKLNNNTSTNANNEKDTNNVTTTSQDHTMSRQKPLLPKLFADHTNYPHNKCTSTASVPIQSSTEPSVTSVSSVEAEDSCKTPARKEEEYPENLPHENHEANHPNSTSLFLPLANNNNNSHTTTAFRGMNEEQTTLLRTMLLDRNLKVHSTVTATTNTSSSEIVQPHNISNSPTNTQSLHSPEQPTIPTAQDNNQPDSPKIEISAASTSSIPPFKILPAHHTNDPDNANLLSPDAEKQQTLFSFNKKKNKSGNPPTSPRIIPSSPLAIHSFTASSPVHNNGFFPTYDDALPDNLSSPATQSKHSTTPISPTQNNGSELKQFNSYNLEHYQLTQNDTSPSKPILPRMQSTNNEIVNLTKTDSTLSTASQEESNENPDNISAVQRKVSNRDELKVVRQNQQLSYQDRKQSDTLMHGVDVIMFDVGTGNVNNTARAVSPSTAFNKTQHEVTHTKRTNLLTPQSQHSSYTHVTHQYTLHPETDNYYQKKNLISSPDIAIPSLIVKWYNPETSDMYKYISPYRNDNSLYNPIITSEQNDTTQSYVYIALATVPCCIAQSGDNNEDITIKAQVPDRIIPYLIVKHSLSTDIPHTPTLKPLFSNDIYIDVLNAIYDNSYFLNTNLPSTDSLGLSSFNKKAYKQHRIICVITLQRYFQALEFVNEYIVMLMSLPKISDNNIIDELHWQETYNFIITLIQRCVAMDQMVQNDLSILAPDARYSSNKVSNNTNASTQHITLANEGNNQAKIIQKNNLRYYGDKNTLSPDVVKMDAPCDIQTLCQNFYALISTEHTAMSNCTDHIETLNSIVAKQDTLLPKNAWDNLQSFLHNPMQCAASDNPSIQSTSSQASRKSILSFGAKKSNTNVVINRDSIQNLLLHRPLPTMSASIEEDITSPRLSMEYAITPMPAKLSDTVTTISDSHNTLYQAPDKEASSSIKTGNSDNATESLYSNVLQTPAI